ncbi:MAG TPA: alpha/beta fold hydrolase [Anaerolineaceae bacterium]|nr:alpha/beta fold hydrolase [Anaerolineaceae bacterium]
MFPNIMIESGFAEVNGIRLYYESAGAGDMPVVFIHAGIADRRMWDAQFAPLAQEMRVLRYDMRGYGQSFPKIGEFAHANDLISLLDHLKISRAVLVGSSKGGATALDLTLAHPERVAGLILVSSAPAKLEFEGQPPRQWQEMSASFKKRNFVRAAELEVEIWVDGPQRTPEKVNSAIRELVREMDMIALANEANALGTETWLEDHAAQRLRELNLPSLVMIGELDDPNIIHAGHWLAEAIPGAQKVSFPDAAHLLNMEKPAEFNQILREFLSSIIPS